MTETSTSPPGLVTLDCLRALGFVDESDGFGQPRVTLQIGTSALTATQGINRWFHEVVMVAGFYRSRRELSDVEFEMPLAMESVAQAAAWVSWHLRGVHFMPGDAPPWLQDGLTAEHLLPWVRDRAAYDARPACVSGRDWLRLALKQLRSDLERVPDDTAVRFAFDGHVLTIRSGESVLALPATGKPWPETYVVVAGSLRNSLRRRLLNDPVGISVWEDRLSIGRHAYPCSITPGPTDSGSKTE